jgi:hypothetical protein
MNKIKIYIIIPLKLIFLYVKNWFKFLHLSKGVARDEGKKILDLQKQVIKDYFKKLNLWQ